MAACQGRNATKSRISVNEKADIPEECRPLMRQQCMVCAQRTGHCDATDGATYGSDSTRALLAAG